MFACSSLIRSYGKKEGKLLSRAFILKGVTQNTIIFVYHWVQLDKLGDMKNHHQLTTSGARCIMSVQYINELATNTKRAYGMKIWEVGHKFVLTFSLFFFTSGGLGPTAPVVLRNIASMISDSQDDPLPVGFCCKIGFTLVFLWVMIIVPLPT